MSGPRLGAWAKQGQISLPSQRLYLGGGGLEGTETLKTGMTDS